MSSYDQNSILVDTATNTTHIVTSLTSNQTMVVDGSGNVTTSASPSGAVNTITFGTTGLTPNTPTAGAVSVAGTLVAASGGTGISSYTIGDIPYASGATTISKLADVATGSAIISGGVGVAPSYGKIGLTTHVSGVLPEANGGTNQSTYTTGDILYASASNTLSKLADVATGNALISGGVGVAPSWGKIGLTTHVSGVLPLANGGTNANLTAVNGGVVYSDGSAMAITAAGTLGQVLQSNGAGAPTWVTPSGGGSTVNLITNMTPASVSATGTVISVTIPANTLSTDGDTIKGMFRVLFTRSSGTFAVGATLGVIGGTNINACSTSLTSGASSHVVIWEVIRTSASDWTLGCHSMTVGTGTSQSDYTSFGGPTWSGSVTFGIACTITTGAGTIAVSNLVCEYTKQ